MPTWDFLQKRQLIGLGWCCLCRISSEDIPHIFVKFLFSCVVWMKVTRMLGQQFVLAGNFFDEAYQAWFFRVLIRNFWLFF